MKPTEAVALCRYAKAYFPQQQFDEYTADAWGDALARWSVTDCQAAIVMLSGRDEWITPKTITAEVKRARAERIDRFGPIEVPPDLSPVETCAFLGDVRRRIADGDVTSNADLGIDHGVLIQRGITEDDLTELMPRVPPDLMQQARADIAEARQQAAATRNALADARQQTARDAAPAAKEEA